MARGGSLRISAGSVIELTAVLVRRFAHLATSEPEHLIRELGIQIMPVTPEQAEIGQAAYRRYGRGTKHAANLNFGDCFAYALAKVNGESLLFKGNDFSRTDVAAAL